MQSDVGTVCPKGFKARIAQFAPQFSGYQQHDSQEFLAFLLDGLHEDINRIQEKPYIEVKQQLVAEVVYGHCIAICLGHSKSFCGCLACSRGAECLNRCTAEVPAGCIGLRSCQLCACPVASTSAFPSISSCVLCCCRRLIARVYLMSN